MMSCALFWVPDPAFANRARAWAANQYRGGDCCTMHTINLIQEPCFGNDASSRRSISATGECVAERARACGGGACVYTGSLVCSGLTSHTAGRRIRAGRHGSVDRGTWTSHV